MEMKFCQSCGMPLSNEILGTNADGTPKYAFETLGAAKVSLGVFENNPSAIRCYEAAGFNRVSLSETESYECIGETWNCIEMELLS